MRSLTAAL
nr:unnamed protein product [Callosobruchus analis]